MLACFNAAFWQKAPLVGELATLPLLNRDHAQLLGMLLSWSNITYLSFICLFESPQGSKTNPVIGRAGILRDHPDRG